MATEPTKTTYDETDERSNEANLEDFHGFPGGVPEDYEESIRTILHAHEMQRWAYPPQAGFHHSPYGWNTNASLHVVSRKLRGAAPLLTFDPFFGTSTWLSEAKKKVEEISEGRNRTYAELALDKAAGLVGSMPRIYSSPEDGIVIEHKIEQGIITLLIEQPIGLLVRSAHDFQVRAEFDINARSINELLARYIEELILLISPPGA